MRQRTRVGLLLAVAVIGWVLLLSQVSHDTMHALTGALVLAAVPGAVLFPSLYATAPRWWASHLGRALFMASSGLAAVICFSALRVLKVWPNIGDPFGGDNAWVDVIRLHLFAYLLIGVYYKTFALLWVRRRGTTLHDDDTEVRSSASSPAAPTMTA